MKIDKNVSLRLQNVGYHLALVSKNLTEALELLGVKSDAKAATETLAKGKGKGKAAPAEEEEMETVESDFSDDPADFDDEEQVEEKSVKGKGKKAPKKDEPADDDNFDFDEAEVEDEPTLTEADVRTAMTTYAKKHSKEKALAILGKFAKSKKVGDVPPAKFQALVDALKVK